MNREDILQDTVRDISIDKDTTLSDLIQKFKYSGGFTAPKLWQAHTILKKIFNKDVTRFLSFPADIVSTGLRGIINELLKKKLVDVIITTAGTLDHDIARSVANYYCGIFEYDDRELASLHISRLGNVMVPEENYGPAIEKFVQPILDEMYRDVKNPAPADIIKTVGKHLGDESSILYNAALNDVPIFVPGITDGSFGAQLWSYYERKRDFIINILEDEHRISDIIFNAKKSGALMIGGGISKHHTIWWNQFRDGLDYAVYLTTAQEFDGSLSGAKLEEAISWNKVKADAEFVNIIGEATVLLPLLLGPFL